MRYRYIRHWWRVTRYDPSLRDERGAFQGDTWIDFRQAGKMFDGEILTLDTYLEVEKAYVDTFAAFAEESFVDGLEVREYERGDGIQEGEIISIKAAREVVRSMLRGEAWCRLESPDERFALHVGYDLYMYVGSFQPCENAVQFARKAGLFVDVDYVSPMIPEVDG